MDPFLSKPVIKIINLKMKFSAQYCSVSDMLLLVDGKVVCNPLSRYAIKSFIDLINTAILYIEINLKMSCTFVFNRDSPSSPCLVMSRHGNGKFSQIYGLKFLPKIVNVGLDKLNTNGSHAGPVK